jgi:hypothetical protein
MAHREVGDDSVGPSLPGRVRCTVNYDFQNYF